jgi:sortase (surface protein transpeptidase)
MERRGVVLERLEIPTMTKEQPITAENDQNCLKYGSILFPPD